MEMTPALCPECGSPLPAGTTEGSCFTCLLMLGVGVPVAEVTRVAPEALAPGQPPEDSPRNEQSGQRIGRYKLLEQIGEGGFGTVWMAEQQEPVRRKVALKIIKLGMDTKQVVARFEAERQALAMMDHPNIARVFDGGATENGRPYFVMELVSGIPLTTYCDTARLATRERLELFIQVCQAVQHAHQKGIIHRDLKPTNILITEQDGHAVSKVIDFGIAKATEQELTERTLFTRFNQMMGTPAYMSPEQAGHGGTDIDTRSDIYALGVLLYELLTGRPPFSTDELAKAGLDEVLRTIREKEAPKPSTKLSTLAQADLQTIASQRRIEPEKLNRLLRGELDWMVMKALEKDRGRRYQNAGDFARDIQRYLHNEVVQARPPSAAYRFQKAWHRNKLVFTAATAVTASLLIGLAVSTWLFVKEKRSSAVLRQSAYASEMNVAIRASQEGRIVRVRELLENQRPRPGETDLRGFEWRYLWKQLPTNELFTLTNAGTWGLALSPDGRTVAGCASGRVGLWDIATRRLITVLDTNVGWSFSMEFTPDGKTLATSDSTNKEIRLWDMATLKKIGTLNTTQSVLSVAYSRDGKFLVTAGGAMYVREAPGEVVLWDAATQQKVRTFSEVRSWSYQAMFSPDGETIAASSGDGTIALWKAATGEVIDRLSGHNGYVAPVTFSRDGRILAAGDEHGHVWLWDWRAHRVESVFHAHDFPIYGIVFSPDERRLISASRDHTARMWDRGTKREIARFAGHFGGVTGVRLLPDGHTLVTSSQDESLKFWDTLNSFRDEVIGTHTDLGVDITFTSNGRFLARSERNEERITFFETETGAGIKVLRGQAVVASSDGKLLSVVRDTELIFLDPMTLAEINGVDGGARFGRAAASPDGKLIAVRRQESVGTNVVIFDVEQKRVIKSFPTEDEAWAPLLFARGRRLLLTVGRKAKAISAWDAESCLKVAAFEGIELSYDRTINAMAVSPDGKTIAAEGNIGLVLVWDVDYPSNPMALNTGAGAIYSLAFSPDGKTLAIGAIDSTIRLWNVAARQEVATFAGHSSYVNGLAFAPDGRTLASVSHDKTLRIWRAPSFEEIAAAEQDKSRMLQP
jgi:WD40 repeat protein/serine/threonine protein kinase